MELFQGVYTYLVISFVLMCFLLFKFTYKKVQSSLEGNVTEVRRSIEGIEKRRADTILKISEAKYALEVAKRQAEAVIQEAEDQAKKITNQSTDIISRAVEQKQREYDKELAQIKIGLYSEMHHKISEMIIKEIERKIHTVKMKGAFQNGTIDDAIEALDQLIRSTKRISQDGKR
ncbi:MAG: ATP synthase F0 subunit B [Holosporales bacterium]|jgi:F-type H+-transporting ATPase subunit b|nr:ATP synthase F0 subunit B [Holosporales bacterium]